MFVIDLKTRTIAEFTESELMTFANTCNYKKLDKIAGLPAGSRATSKDLNGRANIWIKQEDGSWVNIKTGEIVDELPEGRTALKAKYIYKVKCDANKKKKRKASGKT